MYTPCSAPYGSWVSPITAENAASSSVSLAELAVAGSTLYWKEQRPLEKGRGVIISRATDGSLLEQTPPLYNVRTRVQEYGGGAYCVYEDTLFFSNLPDNHLYRQERGAVPVAITHHQEMRYADIVVDAQRSRLIAVREDHTITHQEAVTTLVSIRWDGTEEEILVSGNDFYASPRVSPDGSYLAWLTWNHPNMPWDGTELWKAPFLSDGTLGTPEFVAGGISESIFQPEWSPHGQLCFVSDRTGWWNLYRAEGDQNSSALCPMEADFGRPMWVFGMGMYTFLPGNSLLCVMMQQGRQQLVRVNLETQQLYRISSPYSSYGPLHYGQGSVYCIVGSWTQSSHIARLDLTTGVWDIVYRTANLALDPASISTPQQITFPTEQGDAYGFYYAPTNKDFIGPNDTAPPLLVISHGGPTASAKDQLSLDVQYWTSRGFAVFDVDYGGSMGYGRSYRQRLEGQWGIVDVQDCVNGALFLAQQGLADPDRLIIRGSSAGGYTTLCALTFHNVFKAGASYYGVSDAEALAQETHKFESRYADRLIGPYAENRELYRARSPLHFVDRITAPLIFFQGLDDKVVLPNQSEMMFDALKNNGLPAAYIAFAGEGHGFRIAANIQRARESELYFYARLFGFPLAESIEPVEIANL